jgi:pilus assembly protein Flp/PilA
MAMREMIRTFVNDQSGASALEYGLVVGLIALVIIAGLTLAGGALNNMFSFIGSEISSVQQGPATAA